MLIALQSTAGPLVDSLLRWPTVLGLIPIGLAAWWVWRRTQTGSDPSGSVAFESATGTFSLLISGAYWVAALALVGVLLLWETLMQFPVLWLVPAGLVATAWWLERREVMD